MNEIDWLKRFRADAAEPSIDQVIAAKRRLDEAIASSIPLAAGATPRPKSRAKRFLIPVLAVIAIPSGIAIGGALDGDGDEISPGRALGPSDCPEATAAFEAAGVPPVTAYLASEGCPTPARVDELIRALRQDLAKLDRRTGR